MVDARRARRVHGEILVGVRHDAPVKRKPDPDLQAELLAAVLTARDDGWIPARWNAEEIANVAARRWSSFERRNKGHETAERRVEDLTKGLRDHFESDRGLVGPFMVEYRGLAKALAAVLAPRP